MYRPKDIVELLFLIEKSPGIYIGTKSITRLKSFLDGYRYAVISQDLDFNMDQYTSFGEWFEKKYEILSVESWSTYLLKKAENESIAFDWFYQEFRLFLGDNNIKIPNIS